MASVVSVHGQLVPFFLDLMWQSITAGGMCDKAVRFLIARTEKGGRRGQGPHTLFKGMPSKT